MKRFLVWAGIFFLPFFSRAQDRFRFTPENPRPGDTVYFSYTPPAEWKNEIPHCVIRNVGNFLDNYSAWVLDFPGRVTEIEWSKIENEYKGQIITSPQTALLTFSFNYGHIQMESVGDRLVMKEGKTDWNDSAGFMIRMKGKDNQPVPLANFYAGRFIGSDDMFNPTNRLGMNNTALGINYLEQEIELYGASRNTMLAYYMMQKDIAKFRERSKELLEKQFQKGLKTESDFSLAILLMRNLEMPNMANYFGSQMWEKFKDQPGIYGIQILQMAIMDTLKSFAQKDSILQTMIVKKDSLSNDQIKAMAMFDIHNTQYSMLLNIAEKGDEPLFRKYADKYQYTYQRHNYLKNILVADAFSKTVNSGTLTYFKSGYDYFKHVDSLWELHSTQRLSDPDDTYFTQKEILDHIRMGVILYADKLNLYYYQSGDYKTAMLYASESFSEWKEINDINFKNNLPVETDYLKTAEKVLPQNQVKKIAEDFIRDNPDYGTYNEELLRKIYLAEHGSNNGVESYFLTLRSKQIKEFSKQFIAQQINEPAPPFTLTNLKGEKVSLKDLKGKVVILDFWATWCGICISEFPNMQKIIDSYKNNPNVVFLFVDAWENEQLKDKENVIPKVKKVISSRNLTFNVLLDMHNQVVSDYNVPGMPYKFIIDKNGKIRYKINGGNRSESQFKDELFAMIESLL